MILPTLQDPPRLQLYLPALPTAPATGHPPPSVVPVGRLDQIGPGGQSCTLADSERSQQAYQYHTTTEHEQRPAARYRRHAHFVGQRRRPQCGQTQQFVL